MMQVFKFTRPKNYRTDMQEEEAVYFFNNTHGIGTNEWTLCSIAPEEWNYANQTPVKDITCPDCLREISHAKTYKGKT
jgi:hypothetical protein